MTTLVRWCLVCFERVSCVTLVARGSGEVRWSWCGECLPESVVEVMREKGLRVEWGRVS